MDDQIIRVLSIIVAVLSAGTSAFFSIRARRDARIQRRMQITGLKRQYYSSLQKWADEVIDSMTEAIFLCNMDPAWLPKDEFLTKRHLSRAKLSSLIDRGRLFLPNVEPDQVGQARPTAFRGVRQPSLDYIVRAYDILKEMADKSYEENRPLRVELWNLRKEFVSEIQRIVDPRERERETKELLD